MLPRTRRSVTSQTLSYISTARSNVACASRSCPPSPRAVRNCSGHFHKPLVVALAHNRTQSSSPLRRKSRRSDLGGVGRPRQTPEREAEIS